MYHGWNHVATALKGWIIPLRPPPSTSPPYSWVLFPIDNIQKAFRNYTTQGNQLAHTALRPGLKVGVLYLPSFSLGGWGAAECLSGPGVCVILAVCQSGLGNGHQVITPALTASSISLYHSCRPSHPTPLLHHNPPSTHYLFFPPFSSEKEQR